MPEPDASHPEVPHSFQIPLEIAEVYEERFVPALFADWAPAVADVADLSPGQRVLDVACGTGILTRVAADRVGVRGEVVGLDLNEAMLTVAARVRPDLQWQQGDAMALPFDDAGFDSVVCQMALMFFPDRLSAIREMTRVVRPGGLVTVMVPATLDHQPAWGPFVDVAGRQVGDAAISLLGTYWAAGDLTVLTQLISAAGLQVTAAVTRQGTAHFDSIDQMVTTEVESTPLITMLTPEMYLRLRTDSGEALRAFVAPDGRAELPLVGHIVAARRP